MGRIGCFEPEGWPGFEVGYTLARPFWGRGSAARGARAALRCTRDVLGRERIISLIRPDNGASIRVAERLGAAPDGTVALDGRPVLVHAYLRAYGGASGHGRARRPPLSACVRP